MHGGPFSAATAGVWQEWSLWWPGVNKNFSFKQQVSGSFVVVWCKVNGAGGGRARRSKRVGCKVVVRTGEDELQGKEGETYQVATTLI